MSRTFNFDQSQKLLKVDPKTFGRWLVKANIDRSKQINLADPREKLLTEEQILMLAKAHGREVTFPPPDQTEEPAPPIAVLTTITERLFALEQNVTHGFDQLNARIEELLIELRRLPPSVPPQERPPALALRVSNVAPAISTTPKTTTPPKLTRPARRKRKAKTRKPLPTSYTPLITFRQLHNISEKAVEIAVQKDRVAVKHGNWLYEHRAISIALDRSGQEQFYALFHTHEKFQSCPDCPHAV